MPWRQRGTSMTRERHQAGFTLVELMIAVAITTFMMITAWSTTSGTAVARRNAEQIQARNHEIRVAMNIMASDLSSAYISANEDQNDPDRRTLFIGEKESSVDELRFSSFNHRTLWADANESEQTLIAYYAEDDPEDSSVTNLLRRESRRLSNEPWQQEPAQVDVLLRDVQEVSFEYWDWREKEWKETWDSTAADAENGRLPYRVRITIELENDAGKTVTFTSQARLLLQEELQFFAN